MDHTALPLPATRDAAPTADGRALERLVARLKAGPGPVAALGVRAAARGWVAAHVGRALGAPVLCIAADEDAADRLAADIAFFVGGKGEGEAPHVLRLPFDEILPYDGLSPDRTTELDRLAGLFLLQLGHRPAAIVVSARALTKRVLPARVLDACSDLVGKGSEVDRDELARKLVASGYQSVPLVEDPGTFAVRGGIVDVWSPVYPQPVRLEFFGDEVESLRLFDPESQRTVRELEQVYLSPARELLFNEETRRLGTAAVRAAADRVNRPTTQVRELLDAVQEGVPAFGLEALLPGFYEGGLSPLTEYLPRDAVALVDDPVAVARSLEELWAELTRSHDAAVARGELALPAEQHFVPIEEARTRLAARRSVELHTLWLGTPGGPEPVRFDLPVTAEIRKEIENHHGEEGALTPLIERLKRLRERGRTSIIACGATSSADKLKRLLRERRLHVRVHEGPLPEDPRSLWDQSHHAHLVMGDITGGFLASEAGFAVIADEEILGPRQRRKLRSQKRADLPFVAAFRELNEGDLCVHVDHGICRYEGLTKLNVRGVEGDFLVLQFEGKDKLFLPVSKLRQVQKFVGQPEHARLDRLGGTSWEKTKKRVKDELLKMAAELLDIYARRKAHPGIAYPEPDRYYDQFEADFPYEETPDQAKAIQDILKDMTSGKPMDRLVCGDVGYGKTEVAMRAAFLAVLGKKQVAVLVPTTILALQHFRSFSKRFADYPVQVDWVSSLREAKENKAVLHRAAEGKVDIVIGTHALLGSAVDFKDLGLVIVDEEHRFGVKQKEKLKKLKAEVDVLTLTATPIPRTLNMSLGGVRDLSIINTPPADRRAIRTFVSKFDPKEIREAILREKARGGQVYFVHNRVQSIGAMERFLRELVPEASIGVGHGQMAEHVLEKVISDFIDRKYDVLLCTTIVESGLDIPSANTIIVNRADTFGLAQLYQLRGRVGRSSERAYAHLLVPAKRQVTKDAQRRLEVLQQFSDLGAGFHIASHDLEIRGAGHLLGEKQSGHIEAVGFDLYAELLDEAVRELKGEPPKERYEPEVTLPIPAFLPDEYLPDVHQRLLFYKKLASAESDADIEAVREELVDRCGHPPAQVDNLCRVMSVKAGLRALRLRALEHGPARLVITLGPDPLLDPEKLTRLLADAEKEAQAKAPKVAKPAKGARAHPAAKAPEPRYRLTPDMKLVCRIDPTAAGETLLAAADEVLRDLSRCAAG